MKKYFIGFILVGLSTAAFADFDMRRVNPDPKIQAAKEQCFANSPKDHRGTVYKRPFRQCMIDSGVMVGNYKTKTRRSDVQFMNKNDYQQLQNKPPQSNQGQNPGQVSPQNQQPVIPNPNNTNNGQNNPPTNSGAEQAFPQINYPQINVIN